MATNKRKKFITWQVEKRNQRHNGYNNLMIYKHFHYEEKVYIREILQSEFTHLENKDLARIFRYPFAQQFKKSLGHLKPKDRQYNSREQIATQVANVIIDEWLKMITENIIDGKTYSCKYFDIKVGYRLMTKYLCDFSRDGRIYFPIINIKRGYLKVFKGTAMFFRMKYYRVFKQGLLNGRTYSMPLKEIKIKEYNFKKREENARFYKQQ